jgi:outer membrane receptor protein involved in Fe transport
LKTHRNAYKHSVSIHNPTRSLRTARALSVAAAVSVALAAAQLATAANAPAASSAPARAGGAPIVSGNMLQQIVVTASVQASNNLSTSEQVTTIPSKLIVDMAPRSTAEMLRLIPGVSVQDQAGSGGNANITVRGLPVTTGGSPFVQIQEDGLPQVLFGDMNFGNNDYWTRFDVSNTVQATVGGNAATLAAGAPGAVINFISATGRHKSGQFTVSQGVGFGETRLTFAVGGPINSSWRYHLDGFYVHGRGPRNQGFTGENGYQLKGNITHDLAQHRGFVRLYVKLLNDQEEYNAGGPIRAVGSGNSLASISVYPGFDARTGTTVGIYNQTISYLHNTSGQFGVTPNTGVHPYVDSVGAELYYMPVGNLSVDDKFRVSAIHGTFAAQFFGLGSAASLIGTTVNGQTVAKVVYADGPNAGQVYTGLLNDNTQIFTNMSNMGNVVNDLSLLDHWRTHAGKFVVGGGLFYMAQTIDQSWHPNSQLQALSGTNPANLDLISSSGQLLSNNGVTGYNTAWGQGVDRKYAMTVSDTAPYLDLTWDYHGLQLQGSVRQDQYRVSGWAESASPATTGVGYLSGTAFSATGGLDTPLVSYSTVDPGTYEPLDYGISYRSWSAGALYMINSDTSVYARASRGGKANTDRNILSGYTNASGSLNASGANKAVDIVLQQEAGIKHSGALLGGPYGVTLSYFHTSFGESSFDLTQPAATRYFNERYSASGVEFEGTWASGGFSLYVQATYQDPKVDSNEVGPSPSQLVSLGSGFLPGGMSKAMWVLAPSYHWWRLTGGIVWQGQSQQNIGGPVPFYSPGQNFIDLFGSYAVNRHVSLGIHVNNLLNTLGVGGGGAVTTGPGVVGVSAELGRIVTADVKVRF